MTRPPAIVTDSNASLPPSILQGLPLVIVPLEIHHEGRVYQDGVDISPSAFYELQAHSDELPKTSAPKPGAFLEAFQKAALLSNHIICITLDSTLSSTYHAAAAAQREAAEMLRDATVTIVDSRSAGTAQGLIALEAARLAAKGESVDAVLAAVQRRMDDVCLYGYLETLYYVWRGGRVPRVLMWMGTLLRMKPILQLHQGKIGMVERPRTAKRAMERIVALAARHLDGAPGRIAVMHANAPEHARELASGLERALRVNELFITEFTPVIGAHTGPGLVGCALHPVDSG
ncbi:MAG: DegV family protein [Dehalococcoidia bacterium]